MGLRGDGENYGHWWKQRIRSFQSFLLKSKLKSKKSGLLKGTTSKRTCLDTYIQVGTVYIQCLNDVACCLHPHHRQISAHNMNIVDKISRRNIFVITSNLEVLIIITNQWIIKLTSNEIWIQKTETELVLPPLQSIKGWYLRKHTISAEKTVYIMGSENGGFLGQNFHAQENYVITLSLRGNCTQLSLICDLVKVKICKLSATHYVLLLSLRSNCTRLSDHVWYGQA